MHITHARTHAPSFLGYVDSQGGNLLKCIKLKFVPVFDLVIIGSRTGAEAGSSGTGAGAGSSGIMS